jgi:hypothetical protein
MRSASRRVIRWYPPELFIVHGSSVLSPGPSRRPCQLRNARNLADRIFGIKTTQTEICPQLHVPETLVATVWSIVKASPTELPEKDSNLRLLIRSQS